MLIFRALHGLGLELQHKLDAVYRVRHRAIDLNAFLLYYGISIPRYPTLFCMCVLISLGSLATVRWDTSQCHH
jgi:hypothetical protein